jgi:hypothetical protein
VTQNVRVLILNKLNEQFERKKNILFSPQDEQVQSSEVKLRGFVVLSAEPR